MTKTSRSSRIPLRRQAARMLATLRDAASSLASSMVGAFHVQRNPALVPIRIRAERRPRQD
ncbi:hypothetical protein [Segnochrobactrum spirostomi]|uniref:Uncharacterized protein n=1 Tax=Segnochrobactrum spirostomi TaxID=2608987 RepID=A0A6A7Y596_9HYPH|nr:hypothetical protein [Segnochrobactrum spirostomi]MQT13517.1 hypothetical protein [Segnochrobactrum spirostomi]